MRMFAGNPRPTAFRWAKFSRTSATPKAPAIAPELDRFMSEEEPGVRRRRRPVSPRALPQCRPRRFLRSLRGTTRDGHRIPARPSQELRRPPAVHKKVGPITMEQMLNEWALHDLGHIRQIAELVRARKYLAGAGPLGQLLSTKTMTSHVFLPALTCAGALSAQTFIQMSDPQFGMFSKDAGFRPRNRQLRIRHRGRQSPETCVCRRDRRPDQ